MCKVIAITNQKGGVGKTTTTTNLGIGLARKGKRVLLIDADSQGNLTISLGFQKPDEIEYTLSDVLGKVIEEEYFDPMYGIIQNEEGVMLLPANIELSGIEASLVNVMSRENILRQYIEKIRSEFDYILIDCMPSLGMVTLNALSAADSVLIPVQASYLPVKGLEQLLRTIRKVRGKINSDLKIDGILLTMVDERTNYTKEIISLLEDVYGNKIHLFRTKIPHSVRAAEISAVGMSIYKYDGDGKVAKAYESLVEEVLSNE